MNTIDGFQTVFASTRSEWRAWLDANHASERGAWLIIHKKGSHTPSVTYDEAVEEALAFGWIDSRTNAIDAEKYRQVFTPRRPKSAWASSNKARVARLTAEGRMAAAGLAVVESAKADGSWGADS